MKSEFIQTGESFYNLSAIRQFAFAGDWCWITWHNGTQTSVGPDKVRSLRAALEERVKVGLDSSKDSSYDKCMYSTST